MHLNNYMHIFALDSGLSLGSRSMYGEAGIITLARIKWENVDVVGSTVSVI